MRRYEVVPGNPQEFSIIELAETLVRLTNSKSEIMFAPLPADAPNQRCPDITLAKDKLGWEPAMLLERGLTKTVASFDKLFAAGLA